MNNHFFVIPLEVKDGSTILTLQKFISVLKRLIEQCKIFSYFIARAVKRKLANPLSAILQMPFRNSYRLITQQVLVDAGMAKSFSLFERKTHQAPEVFCISPAGDRKSLSPAESYALGPIQLLEISEIKAEAASNIFYKSNFAVIHDYFEVKADYTSEELHRRMQITPKKVWRQVIRPDHHFDSAALFLDALSSNYAHWLTETLTKIFVFDSIDNSKDVPLVIDNGWHPNMLEILDCAICNRVIYQLRKGSHVSVAKGLIMSSCGYVPFEDRPGYTGELSSGSFSLDALNLVRVKLLPYAHESNCKRVYIKRKSWGRNSLNMKEVEITLKKLGFVSYDPTEMSFKEQLSVFSSADLIYSNSGAALANIVFCKKACKVYVSIPDVEGTSYQYWNKIALSSGAELNYFLEEPEFMNIHTNFNVNIKRLLRVFGQ